MQSIVNETIALALTDDLQTRQDGAKLATPSKWPSLGVNEDIVWGECQGSGKSLYRVCVSQSDLAYQCTCPSRKQPCKHVMGLLLFFSRQPAHFPAATSPDWVIQWLERRQARRPAGRPSTAPGDAKAQAKRAQAREAKVSAGLEELRLWLRDLVRRGLAADQIKTYAFWDRMAARLADAQIPTLARRLRALASLPARGQPGWEARLLDEICRLYLLADSYARTEQLPAALQDDIRTALGWSIKKEELGSLPPVLDRWLVLGQCIEALDNLWARRVWMRGCDNGRYALLLDFAAGQGGFEDRYITGQTLEAALVYYPSAFPQRAHLVQINRVQPPSAGAVCAGYPTLASALEDYATALATNPWLAWFPMQLERTRLFRRQESIWLADSDGSRLPVRVESSAFDHPWLPLAMSGGHPVTLFGEWDGHQFTLLSITADSINADSMSA